MPLIPPSRFPNNASSTPVPINRPPWVRAPVATNNPQAQNTDVAPWRKNLKSGQAPQVKNAAPNSSTEADQQPKTSKLQINLKSVKKPEPGTVNQAAPEPGKAISIPIQIQRTTEQNGSTGKLTTTIPIQRPSQTKETLGTGDNKVPLATNQGKESKQGEDKMLPPPPPPPPGGPPPPPPPPDGANLKHVKIEQLRKAPKKRPDWAGMMKEIERGRVLRHVECNDRSRPIIPKLKSRGKFVFESEAKPASKSDALHNRLINEIQQGVKLKRVHCNDRSKPILTGLRIRRKSSVVDGEGSLLPMEPTDDLAILDIDVLRDELQCAKQMLQGEIEAKHGLERKTRDQKCQIIAMEAEIESLKAKLGIIPEEDVSPLARNLEKSDSKTFKHLRKSGSSLWKSPSAVGIKKSKSGLTKSSPSDTNVNKLDQNAEEELNEYEEEIASLKDAVQHSRKQAEEMEAKYKEAMEKLQSIQNNFEESERKRKSLEKQLEALEAQQDGNHPQIPVIQTAERTTQTEEQILEKMAGLSRQQSTATEADGMYDSEEEESDSDVEVDEATVQKKKQERELKLWENKLKSIKDKQNTSRLERKNLKNLQKKLESELKEANKRHKKLQKEVDKMAKMMMKEAEKGSDDEDEEEEEEEDEEEETEEEEESEEEEEESESDSEDDEGDESSEEDDENASYEDRMAVFGKRVKRRENVLNAMRKGNYLLRANIDRLKDDLEEARIAYHDLEHELNSVLEET